ncbi:YcxB family protein [Isobaculum melis]|nr:YcxB family protein [Isobaculum melis]
MENILWTIGFLVISCILFFEVNILTNFKIKKLINHPENQFFFSEKKLFFSDEKVDIHQEVSESIVQWESFTKIIETKQYLFLFNSSSTGLLIPKKAIPQELYTSLYELFMAKISNQVLIDK